MNIDGAIDTLNETLATAGIEPPRGVSEKRIEAIEEAIAPLRLPMELRYFWERVGISPRRVLGTPEFCPPEFGLNSWRDGREEFPGQAPALLFLMAYTSWNCMSVELDGPHGAGGSLFQWFLAGERFVLRYHCLAEWLERMTGLIAAGACERREWEAEAWLEVEDQPHQRVAQGGDSVEHPVYGGRTVFPKEPALWPAHWQESSDIEPQDLAPHGATHTIADVLASNPASEFRATIAGKVVGLAAQRDTKVRVSDGTGELDVHCPAGVTALGPVIGEH